MRVFHLANGNLYGGIERFLVGLAFMQSSEASLQHDFLLTHEGRLARELRDAGAQPSFVKATRISRPWTVLAARRHVRRLVNSLRPDVVVSHGPWTHAVMAPGVPDTTPLVFYCHNPVSRDWLHALARHRSPTYVIANSEFTLRTVPALFPGTPSEVLTYVLAGSCAGVRDDDLRARCAEPGEVVIVQVSRFEYWKGHRLLLDAAYELMGLGGWRIWFVGGAQRSSERRYEAELRALVHDRGLGGQVSFLGERSDVANVLASADIFCQPNLHPEPFGLVFLEAMASGLPIVTTRGGGPDEFLRSEYSRVTSPAPRAVANALRELIVDAVLRMEMGKRAVRAFSWHFDPYKATQALAAGLRRATDQCRRSAWG